MPDTKLFPGNQGPGPDLWLGCQLPRGPEPGNRAALPPAPGHWPEAGTR